MYNCPECKGTGKVKKIKRSDQQNRALHLYFRHVADTLNDAGLDIRKVLKPTFEIPWTPHNVKEYIFRPVMKSMTGKKSTTQLEKASGEIEQIVDVINRELGKHGVEYIPFPHLCPKCHSLDCQGH